MKKNMGFYIKWRGKWVNPGFRVMLGVPLLQPCVASQVQRIPLKKQSHPPSCLLPGWVRERLLLLNPCPSSFQESPTAETSALLASSRLSFSFPFLQNTHNMKFTILTILCVEFNGIKYIHTVLQPSSSFTSRTFFIRPRFRCSPQSFTGNSMRWTLL